MEENVNRRPPRYSHAIKLSWEHAMSGQVLPNLDVKPHHMLGGLGGRSVSVRMGMAMVVLLAGVFGPPVARSQEDENVELKQTVRQLVEQVQTLQAKVKALEATRPVRPDDASPEHTPEVSPAAPSSLPPQSAPASPMEAGMHEMGLPGGPKLNIRGFLDFNFDSGSAANPLIYPLTNPPSPVHNSFQFGEVDLFMTSKLSESLSFQSEVIFGSDATNNWGIDIERAQLTYKASDYFHISAGRIHTAIGYYNNAFHHGTWFQTATGRPFMYFFEDSGGILPVHTVGVSVGGLVPGTGKWNAHWTAEVGNGTSTVFLSTAGVNPVQNFVSDKNHKAFNVAGYIKPDWLRGLQIGGNYYYDIRETAGGPHVDNIITGLYAVYVTPTWEFMNEFELQRDHLEGSGATFNTPLGYTQISHRIGKFRPYFRWQEVNVPGGDPLYGSVGRFEALSPGLRFDFTDYAALKYQYNRLYTRGAPPKNGLDAQVAFTF
jgi:hypothetical protein